MVRMLVRFRERFEWRAPAVRRGDGCWRSLASVSARHRRGPRTQPGAADGWSRAERGRRLRLLARRRLEHRDHRLGDARPGGGRPQSARRPQRGRAHAGRLPALQGRRPEQPRRLRPHDPRPRGRRRRSALLRRPGPRRGAAQPPPRNGSYDGWPGSTAFAILALRSAGATGSLAQSQSWLAERPERRRRMGRRPRAARATPT